jgi:putative transposase
VDAPDTVWVTDITYIRTLEGFAYLAVVIDLYSRRIVGWSMQSRQTTDVVLQACSWPCGVESRRTRC